MEDYDYLFKIVLIGNAGVGKTCLVRRFTQGLFPPGQGATIGVDFMIKTVEIKGVKVKPFSRLLLFAGNKIDLADKREVHRQRAEEFAEAQSMLYLETSAKESDNVEKLFLDLACELIREAKQNTLDNNDSTPMPGEGKNINYLSCCSIN
ncbi:ras-related protein Rab-30-like [Sinocyclocheilus grahami]|uniref:ras-related protein Rab-30-like n=1 Tax=Sinocyclocheilus grahami TaxID=75366 RepID=UPI0007AC5D9A|nr:PREDICTED: ras-related protein Rab-30-like [Sinocyclocheilus grahami]